MRVLFIHAALSVLTPEYQVHLTLINHLSKSQVDSYFVWQRPSTNGHHSLPDSNSTSFYYDFGRDYSIIPRPSRYQRAAMMMTRFPHAVYHTLKKARGLQPDIVYTSQQKYDVLIGRFLARYFHIPHVIHLHYSVGPWLGKQVIQAVRSTPFLIAVSEFVRQTAVLQGVDPYNVHTIPNTISLNEFQTYPEVSNIRKEFHWPDDAPLVVSVGRLDPMKGHLALFEAFAKVVKRVPEARLLVCGSSTTGSGYDILLRKRVSELNLEQFVVFAGYRKDIPQILRSADIFCLPTELEPCGLVFLEAMAAGLPTVACYSGGVPELIVHGATGLLSYPGDINSLADNISQLILNPEYARRLGQAGRNRLLNEFDPDKISLRWYQVLYQIQTNRGQNLKDSIYGDKATIG